MDSYRSYWNSNTQGTLWVEGEDQDVYEVESRVPLPRPFPLSSTLNEKNAVVVQTQISHVSRRNNGHLLKVISKISLPTPPYTVSLPSDGRCLNLIHCKNHKTTTYGGEKTLKKRDKYRPKVLFSNESSSFHDMSTQIVLTHWQIIWLVSRNTHETKTRNF